jgi:hypothetical protein
LLFAGISKKGLKLLQPDTVILQTDKTSQKPMTTRNFFLVLLVFNSLFAEMLYQMEPRATRHKPTEVSFENSSLRKKAEQPTITARFAFSCVC